MTKVNELGLDIKNCRGQGYDGAGAMSGFRNGCSANILEINRKALYTHCFSHQLNLVVSKTSKISSVDNMMAEAQKISEFFRFSEQRQVAFEKNVEKFCPGSARNKIKDPCRTRWIERIITVGVIVELYPALWETLDEMRLNVEGKFNNKTQKDAFSFFKAIDSFDFIINLITTYKILIILFL